MQTGGKRFLGTFARATAGLVLWALAVLFVLGLCDGAIPLGAAIALTALVSLGLPSLLTRLLLPLFARMGERARWFELWPGLVVVVALLTLVGPPLFARGWVSRRLGGISARHPGASRWIRGSTDTLARWLSPEPVGPRAPAGAPPADASDARDASWQDTAHSSALGGADAQGLDAALEDVVLDATDAASEEVTEVADVTDADAESARDAENVADAADAEADAADGAAGAEAPELEDRADDARPDPGDPGSGLREFARISPCESPVALWAGELALGGTDELVVTCGDGVRVFFLQGDGVVERTELRVQAPAGLSAVVARALVADLDGDGRRDLGVCAYFTSERGGTRGGSIQWARGRVNGQFDAPRALVPAMDCAGLELGDVDGDHRPELLVLERGNPYGQTGRESELRWFAGQGGQWAARGRVRLAIGGQSLWLDDVTRDGITDVIAHVEGEASADNLVVAGARRGPSAVVRVEDVGQGARAWTATAARLDGDARPDLARLDGGLRLWRTSDAGREVLERATRALDFESYRF
jgi:hypothetical protein